MSKNVAFTICAKNYVGLAQVLEKSIKKNNDDIDFFIFVADELSSSDELLLEESGNFGNQNILVARKVLDISEDKWNEISFKYSLTEFCTSIKSKCFSYVFEDKKYEKAIFFDPDILVFNSLDSIYKNLDNHSIILTPHLLDIAAASKTLSDNDMLNTGVFNLGFAALKNNEVSKQMLEWWNVRLFDYCYIDYNEGYFTDQKWMNLLPAYFSQGDVLISNHLGMNVAPWNFAERQLSFRDNTYYIDYRHKEGESFPLLFTHYSGFDYTALLSGKIGHTTIKGLTVFDDLVPLFDEYGAMLKDSNFFKYLKMSYTYAAFENALPVLNIHRRLYRRLLKDDKKYANPYKTSEGSFFDLLKKHNLVSPDVKLVDKSNRSNTPNIDRKVKTINILSRLVYKAIGYQRYFQLLKLLREYSKVENNTHLIDKSYMANNVFSD